MYTGKPLPPLPPFVSAADWADGFVHVCPQRALGFGSNRRVPVAKRPVLSVRSDGAAVVVLPCTSQDKSTDPAFFELTPERLHWTRATTRRSFAYSRYEVVGAGVLEAKIGVMSHAARIDLLKWIKGCY